MTTIKAAELGRETPLMVFDVESVGLHGEGYAVGFVVIHRGAEVDKGLYACPPASARGTPDDRAWLVENVPELGGDLLDPDQVRQMFWRKWMSWRDDGAVLAADCGWPVEARFLCSCIYANPEERKWLGPYPLIDVASVLLVAGMDPLATRERRPDELPVHDPVCDARQSARLMLESLERKKFDDALWRFQIRLARIFTPLAAAGVLGIGWLGGVDFTQRSPALGLVVALAIVAGGLVCALCLANLRDT